ncbi:hypothetical protein MKW94_001181 [Papaver nudicaule]|uniref:INO80 complex subunit B-like conserved region domain-containing protein n=1 Tax=Papaver nudicaule TaxID=74823 RepID=A0AA41W3K1_PAPNU|nr:hypothetical protein [Papaver nudicaule]
MIHTKPVSNSASGGRSGSSSSMKTSQSVDASRPRKKLVLQDTSDDDNTLLNQKLKANQWTEQKEKLSEVEQQLKKAKAAHKRKTQAEKAAWESEAEAIRKILGQDFSRKKKDDKLQKRRDEIAQERTSNSVVSSNTVRWVIGPIGTVVIFPNEIGLPHIFDSKPCSYPPPRAQCVGPSCTNTYRYRDSKSNLPLCSLQCYMAIHEQM